MIETKISDFSGDYSHLNNISKLDISRWGLVRSAITVGHKNIRSFWKSGLLKIIQLLCQTLDNIELSKNGELKLGTSFNQLDPSEKGAVSYYLGQGLTKAVAEKLLNVRWLQHIAQSMDEIELHNMGPVASKRNISKLNKGVKAPDLFGFDSEGLPHVFEAKGDSNQFDQGRMNHAIDQVSKVVKVRDKKPKTQVACFFDMSGCPIKGYIKDPEGLGGIKIDFTFDDYFHYYYSFFLEESFTEFSFDLDLFGQRFRVLPLLFIAAEQPIFYGINKEVLVMLKENNFEDLFSYSFKIENTHEGKHYSLGTDGILLYHDQLDSKESKEDIPF